MMTDDEYNALVAEMVGGLPVTLALIRVNMALARVVAAGGADARATLRNVVAQYRARDAGDADPPPSAPPPPPRRR